MQSAECGVWTCLLTTSFKYVPDAPVWSSTAPCPPITMIALLTGSTVANVYARPWNGTPTVVQFSPLSLNCTNGRYEPDMACRRPFVSCILIQPSYSTNGLVYAAFCAAVADGPAIALNVTPLSVERYMSLYSTVVLS